jgi:hypothetical protein
VTHPKASNLPRTVPGPDAIADAIVVRDALARAGLDEATRAKITAALSRPVRSGTATDDRAVRPDDLKLLIPSAAVIAAGLDPAKTPLPPPPILWQDNGNELLVRLAGVRAELGDGFVEITIPVSCDQTGDAEVTVTFITGTPDRPAGGLATTEDHPRGPAVVVENWPEALIAFAWQTLLTATSAVSGAGGADFSGRELIAAGLEVNADGLRVTPMARHTFLTQAGP